MNDSRRNIALLLAAAVALVVGFLVLKPGSSDTTATTATAPAVTTPAARTPTTTAPATTAPPAPTPAPVTVIRVKGGEPVGGIKELSAKKGDTVRFEVVADVSEEVHTHGYDILENVAPGKPAMFDFPAKLEGVFEIELEQSARQIGKLTVSP